ncbi:MAG: FtsX-like permease family protein [Luteitalea sp.]|nr:FtsX-like permease family protein [Luteitalea sp.]
MRSLAFAWRSLVRQPARMTLGVVGIAAVGALLFDMLLLSRGLVISFRDLLDRSGFDVRVMAAAATPFAGPRLQDARRLAAAIGALPEVEAAVPVRVGSAQTTAPQNQNVTFSLVGAGSTHRRPWRIVAGADLSFTAGSKKHPPTLLVNRNLAQRLRLSPGATLTLRGTCAQDASVPPPVEFRVAGIADFPFDTASQMTAAATLAAYTRTCGDEASDEADLLLVASRRGSGPDGAVVAIRRLRPRLHVFTNEELVDRFQQTDFSYFRQLSVVLASVTLFFGFLLITVLLTVSVNQRFGQIAALRAVGFSRRRVVADVLWESAILVFAGGVLALPLGLGLSIGLNDILREMPGIPAEVSFFVFEMRALVQHIGLLALTALGAAMYPMWLVARLPIAATLRDEVVS